MPVWPEGVVGSITHARGCCAAAAARAQAYLGVGIDLERRGRVKEKHWRHIATPAEIEGLLEAGDEARAEVLFSAKEAFYKAQFPGTRVVLGFQDAEVSQDGDRIEIRLCVDVPGLAARGAVFPGRCALSAQHVRAAVWLER